ncbi:hypothetical protein F5Y15DRAFT_414749 [Xylariaceae sp. FL0016]|nr:hypothetical protein F5Y15DRAFT_414749 [Xylariaceae sp. FL0016]
MSSITTTSRAPTRGRKTAIKMLKSPSKSSLFSSTTVHVLIFALCVAVSALFINSPPQDTDVSSRDAPNPLSEQYPELISGNLNGTTLIVPIPLAKARQLIPQEWGIVENAYRSLLPDFPAGMYPMMAQVVHDHDIRLPAWNSSMPDFSRASFEFPFIDIFGDGTSSFRWMGSSMISASNPMAVEGAASYYGITVYPAAFDPPNDAYRALSDGSTYTSSQSSSGNATKFMTLEAAPSFDAVPYSLDFMKNITNQPVFANAGVCDYYQRLYNTTLTTDFPPVPVVGSVKADLDPFPSVESHSGVYGWQFSTMFLEPPIPAACTPA